MADAAMQANAAAAGRTREKKLIATVSFDFPGWARWRLSYREARNLGTNLFRVETTRFPLPAGGDHLRGVLKASVSHLRAAQHARHFVIAGAVVEGADLCLGAALRLALLHYKMLIGEGGDLRQMRDAQHLLAACKCLELVPHGFRCASTDANVDLV